MENTTLTAPVFTDRPELVAPFRTLCADLRQDINAGKFAPAPIHLDATGEPIDLSGEGADEARYRASEAAREAAAESQIAAALEGFEYLDGDDAGDFEAGFNDD